jgi:hypothetical protein
MGIRLRSSIPAAAIAVFLTYASPAQTRAPDEVAFRALYQELVAINERIRVRSLMDGRRFLYEIVKLYADAAE